MGGSTLGRALYTASLSDREIASGVSTLASALYTTSLSDRAIASGISTLASALYTTSLCDREIASGVSTLGRALYTASCDAKNTLLQDVFRLINYNIIMSLISAFHVLYIPDYYQVVINARKALILDTIL